MKHLLKQDHDQGYESYCRQFSGRIDVTESPEHVDCEDCLRELALLGMRAVEQLVALRKKN